MTDPYVGQARLLPGLLGPGRDGRHDRQRRHGDQRADRPDRPHARQSAGGVHRDVGRRDRRPRRAAEGPRPATRSAIRKHPILLERIVFPEPVIQSRSSRSARPTQDQLAIALEKLSEEDPTFRVRTDEETGQTLISGMGELHLEILVDRMKREFNVNANVGRPAGLLQGDDHAGVRGPRALRQAVGRPRAVRRRARSGSSRRRAQGFVWENTIIGGAIPREYVAPIERGVKEAMAERRRSPVIPLVDVKVTLLDGSFHEVDSSRDGVQGRRLDGHQGGGGKARARLLEPVMDVEVVVPESLRRRGHGRSVGAAREGRRDVRAGRCARRRGPCPALRDVRVRHEASFDDTGAGDLLRCSSRGTTSCPRHWPKRSIKKVKG